SPLIVTRFTFVQLVCVGVLWFLPATWARADGVPPIGVASAADNDLYQVLTTAGVSCKRFKTPAEAIAGATEGSTLLVLADGYPTKPTTVDESFFAQAKAKNLRMFIEFPATLPGLKLGPITSTEWERAVVATDAFGASLPRLRILGIHDCHYFPTTTENPLLVVARVAGFDSALFGLPKTTSPLLFEMNDGRWLIATTKLSNFIQARFAPESAWREIWPAILKRILPPDAKVPELKWSPTVRTSFGRDDALPKKVEQECLRRAAQWYLQAKLLISPERNDAVKKALAANGELADPPADAKEGDGSLGILEGYSSAIRYDGSQPQRLPVRTDCQGETAMVLALDGMLNAQAKSTTVSNNLLKFTFETSGACGGDRGNPKHPAFGHIAWGVYSPAWYVGNYGDDDARVILSTILASTANKTSEWDPYLLRSLLANLRTTGKKGFRGDRVDVPALAQYGWKHFHDSEAVNYSPHFESYLWACDLWAYRATGHKEFLDKTKTGIALTMAQYPRGWRWGDDIERGRMLLCLAWLVRLEDTPQHREWMMAVANDLIATQDKCGAIPVRRESRGDAFQIPQSNEAYGTSETPLNQTMTDPVSDQLYTTGFALLAFHEAFAATKDPKLKAAEDKLAEFLCRIQIRSEKWPTLDGAWFRAFDYGRWEYWASSADVGWGAWSVEAGWGQAWIAATLALRQVNTSFWDFTADSRIKDQWDAVQKQMAENIGQPWTPPAGSKQ
ncbi:MAG TPA: hypothetical protein VL282_09445, partial [Tepidisphaeraceae bacterium]|nr:hypothetical protein [Tepidisphaeraceae bacterium]